MALESVGEGVAEVGSPGAWLPGQADAPEFAAVDVVVPVGEPTSAVGQQSVALSVAESIATALPVRILAAESSVGEVNALGERPGEELASAPVSPAEVRLSGLSSDAARAAGLDGVGFGLSDVGPAAGPVVVRVEVVYDSFRFAYGGDWAGRLQLVALPGCAATTPSLAGCREQTVISSTNDVAAGVLSADVVVDSTSVGGGAGFGESRLADESTLYGLSAGYTSLNGSYAATPLAAAGSWSVGAQMGSFNWSYPIDVAPTGFGTAPAVSVDYSSQAIDGLTPDQNQQGGPVALGWNVSAGGFIERQYQPCVDEHPGNGDTRQDMCWHSDNATISLNGKSSALIPTTTISGDFQEFRLEQDPVWKVVRQRYFSDATVDGGEVWYVYTPDGAVFTFGQRLEPTTGVATNSVWSVPVFGNDASDPCFGVSSACRQAWRWNLDRVRDRFGNVTTYTYTAENNFYKGGQYVRGGYLNEIRYGTRDGAEGGYRNMVLFNMANRCVSDIVAKACRWKATENKSVAMPVSGEKIAWPDIPTDLVCASAASCVYKAPAFWTSKALESIDTVVLGQVIDRVWFQTYWDEPGMVDGVRADPAHPQPVQSFLRTISHRAFPAGATSPEEIAKRTSPDIRFEYQHMDNRAEGGPDNRIIDGKIVTLYWRMWQILNGLGGRTDITYTQRFTCEVWATTDPNFWSTQTQDCYPRWSITAAKLPGWGVFNRYLVNTVTEHDMVAGGTPVVTTYTYQDVPAYHWDDSLMTPLEHKTWSEPRGYGRIAHSVGPDQDGVVSTTHERYFRGMSNNITVLGVPGPELLVEYPEHEATKEVQGQQPDGVNDLNNLRGMLYVSEIVDTRAAAVDQQVSTYYTAVQTAGPDPFGRVAWRLDQTRVETRQRITNISYGPQILNTYTTFDAYGFPVEITEPGVTYADNDKTYWKADDVCTHMEWVRDGASVVRWLLDRPSVPPDEFVTSARPLRFRAPGSSPASGIAR